MPTNALTKNEAVTLLESLWSEWIPKRNYATYCEAVKKLQAIAQTTPRRDKDGTEEEDR